MPNEETGAVYDMTEFQEPAEPETDGMEDAVEDYESETEQPELIDPEANEDALGDAVELEQQEELADVPEGKRSRDSAFAEMRRAREAAEQERDELRAQMEAIQREQRQAELRQAAEEMGLSEQEIREVLEDAEQREAEEAERTRLARENERLNQELLDYKVEQAMKQDLIDIQAIDPSVKSLKDLPEDFFKFRAVMDGVDAYFATKAKEQKTAFGSAPTPGKANAAPVQRDYYTSDELDALTVEEILANKEKVNRSLAKL